ncbi:right-handed parallel beta-helix repeat-containing protein [Defluviicoccus vanus]|uniref:Right-handed parallel beta-helix repeat-containing protein n=1 Tax=Defluviicoccus vanus TaxID=111831 RepID=A0A7H1N372_9PROT|nr:right-handed parallel beta-helix repeat-containing protein [Defluviicoccus vanus]QNT70158.1 right-handed parallel beta-helix repeat-containing protein [Defluviicoccus vanus]
MNVTQRGPLPLDAPPAVWDRHRRCPVRRDVVRHLVHAWPRQIERFSQDVAEAPQGDDGASASLAPGINLLGIGKPNGTSERVTGTKAREIVVDASGNGDSRDIAAAIATAPPGAVIRIRPGSYKSVLTLDKDVHLVGTPENPGQVNVTVSSKSCLISRAADASVSGISLRNDGQEAGPCVVVSSGRLRLEDVEIMSGSAVGLSVDAQGEVLGRAIRIVDTAQHGLVIRDGGRLILEAAAIEGSGGVGAQIVRAGEVEVRDSRVVGGKGVGIVVADGSQVRLIGNTVANNGSSGIEVLRTRGTVIADNAVSGNREAGLFLNRKSDATALGNQFAENGLSGAIIMGSSGRFERNRLEGNAEHGVYLTKGGSGVFTDNVIDGNRGHGIAIEADSRAELRGNRILNNKTPDVIGPAAATN